MIRVRLGEVSVEVDPIPAAIATAIVLSAVAAFGFVHRTRAAPTPLAPAPLDPEAQRPSGPSESVSSQ